MILSNIKQLLKKNKKIFYYFSLFFIVSFLSTDVTLAFFDLGDKSTAESVAVFFEWLLKWISIILALITYLATVFLSPEWINGSLFGLNTHFKDVWILVSNVVYFVFAFILIWIAFMNIIWKWGDQYQLKQALPKFIVWVLIVPFSWFLVQFILSISAILTVSALTLPFDTFDQFKTWLNDVKIPSYYGYRIGYGYRYRYNYSYNYGYGYGYGYGSGYYDEDEELKKNKNIINKILKIFKKNKS